MSFTADHEQLRRHARTLTGYADQLSGTGTRLPGQVGQSSLGSFAQFLSTGLSGPMGETTGAFAHLASTMDKVGEGMRRTAENYQRTDERNAADITGAGR
ncbi:type VII secretion target [Lentzea flaviverrucosa]|uniref:Excreted virulence factor EspC, type VII ESX diderm n=1 Tax=Lentzea flaviverrucosa TaxID=200379 RepID=A0A1H9JGE5_9PSEU|nr:type VII secretion target [Lentzea flaviverrucosa]RDI26499.1 excreted virulence factor EspC (type VII ESX diderm) [Lentzea flaviverrucosa]SEQ85890.1 Excreted virulence factor EspC, type VII ESX diderm [Lentzea flaviverrucosa]